MKEGKLEAIKKTMNKLNEMKMVDLTFCFGFCIFASHKISDFMRFSSFWIANQPKNTWNFWRWIIWFVNNDRKSKKKKLNLCTDNDCFSTYLFEIHVHDDLAYKNFHWNFHFHWLLTLIFNFFKTKSTKLSIPKNNST